MRFKEKIKFCLWNVRSNRHLRSIYFKLPINLRLKIRRSFANSYVGSNTNNFSFYDFTKISERKISADSLDNSLESWISDWSMTTPQKSQATYLLKDEISNETKTLTFDIWDTVIGRYVPAEGIKKGTSLLLALNDWQNRAFIGTPISVAEIYMERNRIEENQVKEKGEAKLRETLNFLKENLSLNINLLDAFSFEVENEIANTYPIVNTTRIFQSSNLEKSFISDFHMSSSELHLILKKNSLDTSPEKIHSSADILRSKRNEGELFKSLGLNEVSNWTHVGDNSYSDWKNATRYGAKIVRVEKNSNNAWHAHDVDDEKLAIDLRNHLGNTDADRFIVDLAALSYGLCTTAMKRAWTLGFQKVVYLSREGETLKKAHDVINKNAFFDNFPKIEAIHFPVSRSAIVMASWAGFEDEGLNEIALQYPFMEPDALIETLGIPESMNDLVRRNFGRLEKIRTKDAWGRLDVSARSEISRFLSSQKEYIHEYIVAKEINPFQAITCDLGWRGSIQDAMGRIFKKDYDGVYLGIFNPFQDENRGNKSGLIFDEPNGMPAPEFLKLLGPVERAFTISDKQVSGYSKSENRIKVEFQRDPEVQNPRRIALVNENFEPYLSEVSSLLLSIGYFAENSKMFMEYVLFNWIKNPNSIHAAAWFDELHREGYGVGSSVQYANVKPNKSWLEKSLRSSVREGAQNSLWVEGYLQWKPVKALIEVEMTNE